MAGISISSSSKDISLGIIVFGVIGFIVAAIIYFANSNLVNKTTLYVGDGVFDTKLALTPKEREKGLSGQAELKETEALLLAFPSSDKWSIWMKDMLIPIDIVWLDDSKRVVYIVKDADPSLGEQAKFTPQRDARYVIELSAGSVDAKSIKVGHSAIFSLAGKKVE